MFFEDECIGIFRDDDNFAVVAKNDVGKQAMSIPHAVTYFNNREKYYFCSNSCIRNFINKQKSKRMTVRNERNGYNISRGNIFGTDSDDIEDIC